MPAPKNAPLYQQIYDEIKDAIEKGVYAPKERIPSELELAEQYDVSRITVRRAVEELCSDGYLVKQQGRGTFVSTPHINRQFHASTLQTFTALCADNGMKARTCGRSPDCAGTSKRDGVLWPAEGRVAAAHQARAYGRRRAHF